MKYICWLSAGFFAISAVILPFKALAADSGGAYDYLLVLPLQHNYYQPVAPQALGEGNGLDFAVGALALFGNPARMISDRKYQAALSASNMSGGRSSLTVTTTGSQAAPSSGALGYKFGINNIALGWRCAMKTDLYFPDLLEPDLTDNARLELRQYTVGWALSAVNHLGIGAAISLYHFNFSWEGSNGLLAEGEGSAPSFSAGLSADLGQDFYFTAGIRSKSEMSCITSLRIDPAGETLKLAGAVPQTGWASVSYFPEHGFETYAGMELTGWHLVSEGYWEQMDYHLGFRVVLPWNELELYGGSYSLKHPLDPFLRKYDEHLQNLFFITGGFGYVVGPAKITCAGATSHPLSGKGMNQNILSVGIEYKGKKL